MSRSRLLSTLAVVAMVAALGTACGETSETSSTYNDADVMFTSEMVAHHRQAVAMVDMAESRVLAPEVAALASRIRKTQQPEIDEMCGWLEDWDKPVPRADTAGGTDDMDMGGDMAAMMTTEQMHQLEDAPDADFETLWLRMMLTHHEGAVTMADTEIADGRSREALRLAQTIKAGQGPEITQMQALLAPR